MAAFLALVFEISTIPLIVINFFVTKNTRCVLLLLFHLCLPVAFIVKAFLYPNAMTAVIDNLF